MQLSITVWSLHCSDGLCRAFIFKHPLIKQRLLRSTAVNIKSFWHLASQKAEFGFCRFTCGSAFGTGMGCLHPGAGSPLQAARGSSQAPLLARRKQTLVLGIVFFPYVFTALCSFKDSLIFLFQFRPLC